MRSPLAGSSRSYRRLWPITGAAATMLMVVACQSGNGHLGTPTPSTGIASPAPVGSSYTMPTPSGYPLPSFTPPIRIVGIQKTNQGPFSASIFLVDTFWEAPIGQTWYLVYAGGVPLNPASPEDGVRSAVALFTQGSDPNAAPAFSGFYTEPSAAGQLTIFAVTGENVALRDERGDVFQFDVVSHVYVPGAVS